MRNHGGDMDWAVAQYGGGAGDRVDLSAGINRSPHPIPGLPAEVGATLPTQTAMCDWRVAAAKHCAAQAPVAITAGARSVVQKTLLLVSAPGLVRLMAPPCDEHATVSRASGWQPRRVARLRHLAGARLGFVLG